MVWTEELRDTSRFSMGVFGAFRGPGHNIQAIKGPDKNTIARYMDDKFFEELFRDHKGYSRIWGILGKRVIGGYLFYLITNYSPGDYRGGSHSDFAIFVP